MKTKLLIKLFFTGLVICMLIPLGSSAQVLWEKYPGNPVLESFANWTNNIASPVVIFENGIYKMWFQGESSTTFNQIGYAESVDGIIWTPNSFPVVPAGGFSVWDRDRNPGYIIRMNDTLKMWYSGSSDDYNLHISIGYAESMDDGITWVLNNDPVLQHGDSGTWDETAVYKPVVCFDGDTYHMWYHGFSGTSIWAPGEIGYATSTDGINWIKYNDNPVINLVPETFFDTWVIPSCVLFIENEYHLWFTGWDGFDTSPMRYMRIGYATSNDGMDWTVQNDSLAVLDVTPGAWDNNRVYYPSVLVQQDTFRMWYTGNGTNDKIGYASSPKTWINPGISDKNIQSLIQTIVFPNPLSSQATIEYKLIDQALAELKIYNHLGKEIDILVSEFLKAGTHQAVWNSEGLPAGVYFYRLTAGAQVGSGKIIKR